MKRIINKTARSARQNVRLLTALREEDRDPELQAHVLENLQQGLDALVAMSSEIEDFDDD